MNNKEILQGFWQWFYFYLIVLKKERMKKEKLIWDMLEKLIN